MHCRLLMIGGVIRYIHKDAERQAMCFSPADETTVARRLISSCRVAHADLRYREHDKCRQTTRRWGIIACVDASLISLQTGSAGPVLR